MLNFVLSKEKNKLNPKTRKGTKIMKTTKHQDISVHPEEVFFNFKGAFLMWKDNDGNRYYAHLGNDYLDKSEEVRPIFTQALNECREDGDPVVSIENYLEEHGYPIPVTFALG